MNICYTMLILLTLAQSNSRKKIQKQFCQSVQICCREKEKVKNNGHCKAFCVIRKYKKDKKLRALKRNRTAEIKPKLS